MADPTKDPPAPKATDAPTSVRRASLRTIVVVQLVLVSILLLSINYLSASYHRTWDLTQSRDFTLSNQTRSLLKSDLVRGRNRPIHLVMAVQKGSPHRDRLRALAEEYERLSSRAVTTEFVDPKRDNDRALELADQYNTVLVEDNTVFVEDVIIIDAVPDSLPEPEGEGNAEDRAQQLEELRQSHIQFIKIEDILLYGMDGRAKRRQIGYQDEDQLTSGILRAIEGKSRRFYFLADKSQIAGSGEDAPWEFLRRTFASLNIELIPIRISGLAQIPADAAGIALVAPRYDLDDRELAVFREYWNRPRAAAMVILDPTQREQPPKLRAFLREHGVTPRPNRLFTMQNGRRTYNVAATFTNTSAAGDLGNATTLFEGSSSTLEIRENAEDLDLRRIEPYPLIEALGGYFAERLDGKGEPAPGPHYIGASISRGNERSDATADQTARMIVLSNTDFLEPRNRHKEHIDLLHNATHWLVGRDQLMGIGPKPVQLFKLNLDPPKVRFTNQLNMFFIPGFFLLVAVFVWNARRV